MGSIIHRGRSRPGLNHPVGETLSGGSRRRGVRDCRSAVKIDVGVGINKGSVRVDILDREAFRALGRGVPFAVEILGGSGGEALVGDDPLTLGGTAVFTGLGSLGGGIHPGMAQSLALGQLAVGAGLGVLAVSIHPGMAQGFALGLGAGFAGLGGFAGGSGPAVAQGSAFGFTAVGAGLGGLTICFVPGFMLTAAGSQCQSKDQNQNDQDQNNDNNQNQNQQQQQQGQPPKISPQAAQQMLQAIQAKEKETQDKVNKQKAEALKSRQKEKNW